MKEGGDPLEEKNKDLTAGTGAGPEKRLPGPGSREQDPADETPERNLVNERPESSPAAEGPEKAPAAEYASPMKRLWAWVGLVYAVGYALLMAYAFAHGDFPQGIGQLFIAPALAGLGASVILRYREGKGRGGLPVCVILAGTSFALAAWNLIQGLPVLLGQL